MIFFCVFCERFIFANKIIIVYTNVQMQNLEKEQKKNQHTKLWNEMWMRVNRKKTAKKITDNKYTCECAFTNTEDFFFWVLLYNFKQAQFLYLYLMCGHEHMQNIMIVCKIHR